MAEDWNQRILVVDDNPPIHEDFAKIFARHDAAQNELADLMAEVFGEDAANDGKLASGVEIPQFDLDHAHQGEEAVRMVEAALAEGRPYGVMFIDVRMPPGMSGIETIGRIWELYPDLEVVICTAYSDYSWEQIQILQRFGSGDQLLFLRKPFDVVSVKQMALALARKWALRRQVRRQVEHLEERVAERTAELRQKIAELEKAMAEIKELRSILPMCSYCHKIRSDANYWQQVDEYIQTHNIADISHGVCPDCYEKVLMPMLEKQMREAEAAQQAKPAENG
jgi:CheY-like chemotaxis protein